MTIAGVSHEDLNENAGARYAGPKANPRVAFVVFNAMTHDTRVIREAQAAIDAGATVRVFAFGGERLGLVPAGLAQVDGIEVDRISISSLAMILTPLMPLLRFLKRLKGGGKKVAPKAPNAGAAKVQSEMAQTVAAATAMQSAGGRANVFGWIMRQAARVDKVVRQYTFWYRAVRAVRAWNPDLVHAHDANTLMVVGCAARRLKVPFVYDSHELWTKRNISISRPVAERLEGPMERYWIRRAAGVITVSPSIADWLQQNYNLKQTPALVRNIPPFTGTTPDPAQGRLRELAGLDANSSVVAYCGSITTNRGVERGIEALVHLDSNVHLVLLGPGAPAQLEALAKLAAELEVSDRVHVVGSVPGDQVSAALADADVSLVLTKPVVLSYAFSLPNKLFESMHAGIPVLVSDTPDASALVRQYGLGEVVASEGPSSDVAAMITKVIEGEARFREGAINASRQLNWQTEVLSLIDVHNRALQATR